MGKNYKSVFIVKIKWNENETQGQVKRVFFKESNALKYINDTKVLEGYENALFILSDRNIEDYEPCLSRDEIEIIKIDAAQDAITSLISDDKFILSSNLEDKWAELEQLKIDIEDGDGIE